MIVSIYSQKGGVGKTTTAHALAAGLARRGYSVLAIDLDGQANFTNLFDIEKPETTVFDFLNGDTVEPIRTDLFDLFAGSKQMDGADVNLGDDAEILKRRLEPLKARYHFIILDNPPALGMVGINSLAASDRVIIPVQADKFSAQGFEKLAHVVDLIREGYNPGLIIDGLLITRYNKRTVLARGYKDYFKQRAEDLGTKLYKTQIRDGIAIQEAQTQTENIFDYAPRSKAAADYNAFIDEFLKSCNLE